MKNRGFTLIELMIGIALVIIFVSVVASLVGTKKNSVDVSWGINGVVETRCIEGYKFVITDRGQYGGSGVTQVLDTERRPVPCGPAKPVVQEVEL